MATAIIYKDVNDRETFRDAEKLLRENGYLMRTIFSPKFSVRIENGSANATVSNIKDLEVFLQKQRTLQNKKRA